MKKFIQENFTIIVLVVCVLTFVNNCTTSREIAKINKEFVSRQEKYLLNLQLEGLKSEKRMIQATDRKILDVQRQTEIDKELSKLINK